MTKLKKKSSTSKVIKKLRGVKPEKVTKDQLEKIQNTVNQINRSQLEIGASEVKKHEILHRIANFRYTLSHLQLELEKEYGTFDVNIQDGTINYPENDETNKKD